MEQFEIIIIGSGFGAIGCAIKLKEAGISNFVILEKEDDFGGTWYLNTYPGAAVDVQSYLYSYSFEPYNWSRIYAKQPEILEYTNHVIKKYKLRSYGRLNEEVITASFDETHSEWIVETKLGNFYKAPVLINATGVLNAPSIPEFEGSGSFKGTSFHSAKWDHSFDYKNKRVAVIGTGASGIQVIPAIAPDVKDLFVFQRTPHWILKRPDRPFKEYEQKILSRYPLISKLYRELLFWKNESRIVGFTTLPSFMKLVRYEGLYHIRKHIKDKILREKVTPAFMIGCKRILLSNDYYPALERKNVSLISDGIQSITPEGIITKNGTEVKVDLIVYCTGFRAADYFPYELVGRSKVNIHDSWKNGGHAYLGTTIPGFPNFFMLGGPNTGIGHTSALHIAESQLSYIIDALIKFRKNRWKSLEIKEEIESAYNKKLHKAMSKTIWQTGGCKSWYQNDKGENTTLYPRSNVRFKRDTRNFIESKYIIEK